MPRAQLHFVTDPICAWCWGMLPEVEAARRALPDAVDWRLRLAGLQVGRAGRLGEQDRQFLLALWHEVSETTGQRFGFGFPEAEGFIYHSELPCRLLTLARRELGAEPWDLFHALQEAFYLDAQDVSSPATLAALGEKHGLGGAAVAAGLQDEAVVAATRAEFDWCRSRIAHRSLPTVLLDTGQGPTLLCGGYATADYLQEAIAARLKLLPPPRGSAPNGH